MAICEIAKWKELDVLYEDELSEKEDVNGSMMAKLAVDHMRGSNEFSNSFDCIIFSSNMHPADQTALIASLKKGNMSWTQK